jgi:uncharacterized protein YeeX (DUF496 family)
MINYLIKRFTKNYTEVPLFWVLFNLNKYQKNGTKNSCIANIHPMLKNDEYIESTLNNLIDYIRDNYDMEELSK